MKLMFISEYVVSVFKCEKPSKRALDFASIIIENNTPLKKDRFGLCNAPEVTREYLDEWINHEYR